MSETATDNHFPAGQAGQSAVTATTTATRDKDSEAWEIASMEGESPATVGTATGETAREVAAQHFARLMYSPLSTWSRYVFHENEPHPYRPARQIRGRG